MTKDHYTYISEHFELDSYHGSNSCNHWMEDFEGSMIASCVRSVFDPNLNVWDVKSPIGGESGLWKLFCNFPTLELAEEVCKMIIETEILFV